MTPVKIHQYDGNMTPDSDFMPGDIELLSVGNLCRLLDQRRTPGFIEKYFDDTAMFRWRITAFEHSGRYWDLPAEDVVNYQFSMDATRLDSDRVGSIKAAINRFQTRLVIKASGKAREETESAIAIAEGEITRWLESESAFLRNKEPLDLGSRAGPESLGIDLIKYMASLGMGEVERRTADNIVLNPCSGEWVKGMELVLAEMGLVQYRSKVLRAPDVFEGPGDKDARRQYLIHRLAFVRAFFSLLGIEEVVLYRGASIEGERRGQAAALASCTFSLTVARSFCNFDRTSRFKHSYLVKRTVPVNRLFMTYLETRAMNEDYKEAEALILRDDAVDAIF
jgi:hypothetical protein